MKKSQNPTQIPALLSKKYNTKIVKYLILLNRDTGQLIPTQVTTPIEYVPYGFYALPFIGSRNQIDKLIHKYERNPLLLEKYTEI